MYAYRYLILSFIGIICLTAAALTRCTNSPYRPGETAENTMFLPLGGTPAKMDTATAYSGGAIFLLGRICEPPFDYHFLKRPYQLIGRTAQSVPEAVCYDRDGNRLEGDPPLEKVARVEYTIRIKPGIRYQQHPCFAKGPDGQPLYRNLTAADVRKFDTPNDFPQKDTRELVAEDYVRAGRRLADPRFSCPVLSTLERQVLGLRELAEEIKGILEAERASRRKAAGISYNQEQSETLNPIHIDYLKLNCPGFQAVDRYTFRVTLVRKYPIILNWMAMPFFAPAPQEALDFYDQPPLIDKQIVLNFWPVGTGAYYLDTFRADDKVILRRNGNFREEYFPSEGEEGDREAGNLDDAGKRIPFIDALVMSREKETIPNWNKFLQGYYDTSYIPEEVFGETMQMSKSGDSLLTDEMKARGIRMEKTIGLGTEGVCFNMQDDVVGGNEPARCKLRLAISIALDYSEYRDIFKNARGILAEGIVPFGLFGAASQGPEGVNPFINEWDPVRKKSVRKPVEEAQRLMTEAGYPGGRDKNGRQVVLYFDHCGAGSPGYAAVVSWMRRRLEMIGIDMRERGTDFKRFCEKLDTGNFQMYGVGFGADYPDPENFFFLLYGPNSKVKYGGENNGNYEQPEFDVLFEKMESLTNGPERLAVIKEMNQVIQRDAPWVWGLHPEDQGLYHAWLKNTKINRMTGDTLKYMRLDPELRVRYQRECNKPRVWPVVLFVTALLAGLLPAIITAHRRERRTQNDE